MRVLCASVIGLTALLWLLTGCAIGHSTGGGSSAAPTVAQPIVILTTDATPGATVGTETAVEAETADATEAAQAATASETPHETVNAPTRRPTRFRLITSTPDPERDATMTAVSEPLPTNVVAAQQELAQRGLHFTVLVISPDSPGVQGAIYLDLLKRHLRATSGPDEGFDTHSLSCYPNCVLIRAEVVNEISVESWVNVLRHEQRHMMQASNNPTLASDFRPTTDGLFTTYAAFMEACADDGIFVAENIYHSSERMPLLRGVLGTENASLLEPACAGFKTPYASIVTAFEGKQGEGAFAGLFPPYH